MYPGGAPPTYRNALMGGMMMGTRGGGRGGPMGATGRGASFVGGGRGGNRGGPRRGSGQQHQRREGDREKLKFDSDYDFEKANEQFQETLNHLKDELKCKAKISGASCFSFTYLSGL